MALMDTAALFSDAQAITADAFGDVIDLESNGGGTVPYGAAPLTTGVGWKQYNELIVQVVADFNNLTTLDIELQQDTVENFASPTVLLSYSAALADLVIGFKVPGFQIFPETITERYVRMRYNVQGTNPTTGAITAGLAVGLPSPGR